MHRGRRDDRLRAVRRHDRDHLGADRQGGAAAGRGGAAGPAGAGRGSASIRRRCSPRPPSRYGAGVLAPGKLVSNPLEAVSLGLALMFGTAGLPHILMRFYTVPDARGRAPVGVLRHGADRLLLSHDVHARLRRHGAGRPPRPSGRWTRAATWRRRCWRRCSAARRSWASSPRSRSPPSSRWWRASRLSGAAALSHDLWVNVVRGAAQAGANEQLRVARGRDGGAGRRRRSCSASRSRARTSPSWWGSPSPSRPAPIFPRWCCRCSGAAPPPPGWWRVSWPAPPWRWC